MIRLARLVLLPLAACASVPADRPAGEPNGDSRYTAGPSGVNFIGAGYDYTAAGFNAVSVYAAPGKNNAAVFNNLPGAIFNAQSDSYFGRYSLPTFNNAGTFRKSVNAGTTTIGSGISFNNAGAVEVEAATLLFNGGLTNNGAVSVSSGATNRLAEVAASIVAISRVTTNLFFSSSTTTR